jgi:hypothetical protein
MRVVQWIAEQIDGKGLIENAERLDQIFEPLRLIGVVLLLVVLVFQARGRDSFVGLNGQRLKLIALVYGGISAAVISVVAMRIHGFFVSSVTDKDMIAAEARLLFWVFEILFMWGVAAILIGLVGFFRTHNIRRAESP